MNLDNNGFGENLCDLKDLYNSVVASGFGEKQCVKIAVGILSEEWMRASPCFSQLSI